MSVLSRWKECILTAFFPKRCPYCGEVLVPQAEICAVCASQLPSISLPVCRDCGCAEEICRCKHRQSFYDGIVAPFYYENIVVRAVHRFKFEEKDFTAKTFAKDMAQAFLAVYPQEHIDFITFVPFSEKQAKQRAFNPSEVLARELAKVLELPCQAVLCKLYETKTQHFLKSNARSGNVLGVYDVLENAAVEGKSVLLVDDIKTTGATLSECAKMLKLSDAEKVLCCTFAVAKPKREKS